MSPDGKSENLIVTASPSITDDGAAAHHKIAETDPAQKAPRRLALWRGMDATAREYARANRDYMRQNRPRMYEVLQQSGRLLDWICVQGNHASAKYKWAATEMDRWAEAVNLTGDLKVEALREHLQRADEIIRDLFIYTPKPWPE